MRPPSVDPDNMPNLRQKAEKILSGRKKRNAELQAGDLQRFVHELEVHQIELELQNEELVQSRIETEAALVKYTNLYDFAPVGYITISRDGVIHNANLVTTKYFGVERSLLLNKRFGGYVAQESFPILNNFLKQLDIGDGEKSCELALISNQGEPKWVQLEGTCFGGSDISRLTLTDITERKKIEALLSEEKDLLTYRVEERTADLIRINSELEHALRTKDDFLASMSHELRTPLNGILGLSESLQLNTYGELEEKQVKVIETIEESGKHLLVLINDILDLSKINAGMFEISLAPFSLEPICRSSLNLTKGMSGKKKQHVTFSFPNQPIIINGDAQRLKQVCINLLSNAVKFTPVGGELGLDVDLDELEQHVKITVWDKGIGIKPEEMPKLFKAFTQIDAKLSRQYEGTGLGLSLVKKIVELHHGTIQVTSTYGEGSQFIIVLPVMDIKQIHQENDI